MARVTLEGLGKTYGGAAALEGVDLDIAEGEFLAVLGPSGCGKSTLLRLVAGFETPDAGRILFDGEPVSTPRRALPPERRGIGMVFQSYALWPHMTVAGNVGFALKLAGLRGAARTLRVEEALGLVGLAGFGPRRPSELSGGQRQRVALARCLAASPRLVLMDEPLSNLDAPLREAMHAELRALHRSIGATILYVTHDQAEAMALADRIAVLDRGRLRQVAAPATLYRAPADAVVARFVGAGVLVPAVVEAKLAGGACRARLLGVPVTLRWPGAAPPQPLACLRPEDIVLHADPGSGRVAAEVASAVYQGAAWKVVLRAPCAPDVALIAYAREALSPGDRRHLEIRDGFILGDR